MTTRCKSPRCTEVVTQRVIDTGVPGAKPVTIAWCRSCDTRTCGVDVNGSKCDARVLDPHAKRCPRGHML